MSRAAAVQAEADRRAKRAAQRREQRARIKAAILDAPDAKAQIERKFEDFAARKAESDRRLELACCESAGLLYRRLSELLEAIDRAQPYIGVRLVDMAPFTLAQCAVNDIEESAFGDLPL